MISSKLDRDVSGALRALKRETAEAAPRRNRRLTDLEIVRNRLVRANWNHDGELLPYFRKGNLRIIVDSETLLTAFEWLGDTPTTKVEWEISFGSKTPWKVVMAAVNAAVERGM